MTTTETCHPESNLTRRLYLLTEERAKLLHANLHDGYTDGYERTLATELIGGLTEAEQAEALDELLTLEMYSYPLLGGLLDETADGSYKALQAAAKSVLAEIRAQGAEGRALLYLITHDISTSARMICRYDLDGTHATETP